ncbi:MAG: glycosyltransferase family 2 protein [Deltaproteobacteria bacterium]|jgi:glycosyltransferase involved in cell wall biosynthesis|nr:glycosyltransferase family 2 protein [Deltaproteobacteria bacterium]
MKLSVALMSFNEEKNIRRTLEAVLPLADEIVLVDSFSTDKTTEIASSLGANIFREHWKGYVEQTNSCLRKCGGEWILILDCDEVASPELLESIKGILDLRFPCAGYLINRRTFYMGKLLKYAWQPDRKLRLVRRDAAPRCAGHNPHPVLRVDGKTGRCSGELLHYSYENFSAHMAQTQNLARQIAESYHRGGRKSGFCSLLFKPPLAFFKRFVLQRACLDGVPGLMAAVSSAVYAYMKYAFLWELGAGSDRRDDSG